MVIPFKDLFTVTTIFPKNKRGQPGLDHKMGFGFTGGQEI